MCYQDPIVINRVSLKFDFPGDKELSLLSFPYSRECS